MQWPSFSLIFGCVFLVYVTHSIWSLAQLFVPPPCQKGDRCLKSYLHNKPKLELAIFSSVKPNPSWQEDVFFVDKISDFNYTEPSERMLTLLIPESTRKNGTLYLHLFLGKKPLSSREFVALHADPSVVYARIRLTQYHVPAAEAFQLLGSATPKEETKSNKIPKKQYSPQPVTHIKSRVTFNILTGDITLPSRNLPQEIARLIRLTSKGEFLPVIQYDFLNNRLRDLVKISSSNSTVNISLIYAPVGIGKLRLMQHLETALRSLLAVGFLEKDVDEVKSIFADTNLYLLCVTIFVAAVHLLFDFLAFKNDISFWRSKQNFVGLSTRTVAWRAFSQGVVFLYLLDENTTFLVVIPAGIATLIEIWKFQKVINVDIVFQGQYIPKLKFTSKGTSLAEQRTQEFDAESMRYLSYLLYPICLIGAIYSLLYEPHKSWYSWTIHSLVNGVYAFGFLFMLPQLFVNYRLKSVAHLPWRAFMYKAFNTFIDDLFAFVIPMPTAHRVACFRDDVVFLIYLYQRW
ncbi:lipid scramblase CLPTM1L isoform X2 [Anabrus simplex]